MSPTAAVISEKLLLNRHSCEGAMVRKSNKANLDINHRSIQSDPGICFEFIKQNMDTTFITTPFLSKKKQTGCRLELPLTDLRSVVLRRSDAGAREMHPGRTCLFHSMLNNVEEIERSRKYDVPNSQYSSNTRIISTSLSSSAASLYSEDEHLRSSINSSPIPSYVSECPSLLSRSSRHSFSCIDEEEAALDKDLNKIQQNIDNNNINTHDFAKIDDTLTCFNLNNNCQEDKSASNASLVSTTIKKVGNTTETSASEEESGNVSSLPRSREVLADQEEEDYEQYAISDKWFLEENGRRWARIEETESSLDSPALENKIVLGRARVEDLSSTNNGDNNNTVGKSLDSLHPHNDNPLPSGDDSPVTEKPPKQKGSRFLKRFGGDLKKLSSFKKKEFLHRSNSADKAQEHSPRSDKLHFSSGRGLRRNHKVVIGQPTLEEGCERVNQMKCVPVHHPACAIHGQHIGRKNSSHSLISTSSSGAGSITSTTGSRTNPFDGHLCMECSNGFEIVGASKGVNLKETEQSQDQSNTLYLAPPPHKPGTFPTALREQTETEEFTPAFSLPSSESSSRSHSTSDVTVQWPDSSRKLPRARSIYDNLDEAGLCSITQDFLNIFDLISPIGNNDEIGLFEEQAELLDQRVPCVDVAFWSVDDIVEHTQSLQQMVQSWESDEENFDDAVDSMENIVVSSFAASAEAVPSVSSENASTTESETEAVRSNHREQLNQLQTKLETLKRSMPVCKGKKVDASQLHSLSAGQLMMLRRLAVLKLTASMEKFSNKTSHSWSVPRFIRRFKVPDYKDKTIFGVPLLNNVQQFGQALPPCIQHALEYLRNTSLQQIGIFRKPGVRLRIENLRSKCEDNPHLKDFDDSYSAFDVADLVKKYFRELPDPLMTVKLSETFVGIFSNISQELRPTILQAAVLLLPDENREALKSLLHFLLDVASNASENQMSASNLSTCLTPSLFHLQINSTKLTSASSSPKLKKSQMGKHASASVMKPNIKEMNDNKAATQCLTFMIENIDAIFKIPEDSTTQCRMSVMHQPEDVLASEIGSRTDAQDSGDYFKDYHAHIDKIVAQTIREEQKISQNKTGNWQSVSGPQETEIMYKKLHDGNPLRLWRTKVDINNASPDDVLHKILNERNDWDDNLLQCEVLEQPDNQTQVYQFVVSEMTPHPSRDYCVLRTWRKDPPNARGTIAMVESSTNPQPLAGDVRGVVLTSRYVIEPIDSNKCSLVHICRIDSKGHNPEWYNKAYGHLVAGNLLKIRDSIHSNISKTTKAS